MRFTAISQNRMTKKPFLSFVTGALLPWALPVHGQTPGLPGDPAANGLTPKTETIYVNTPGTVNNGNTESLGLAIAGNGNVIVGWEDDHAEDTSLQYLAAAWTIFNSSGAPVTPETAQTSQAVGGSTTNRFLSYFRADGSAIPPFTSWGPKIKANLFGEGLGMGATSYALGMEVPEFAAIQNNAAGENAGDFPSVQLLSSAGSPVKTVSGVPDDYAEREGDIRIGDWDYLSNGNILVVGESRQRLDLVDIYGGAAEQTHVIYRIVDPAGAEVKAVSLGSEFPETAEMWHGSAVTRNGFALRFGTGSGATVRLFNNDGTPASTNINLAELTGHPLTGGGGRGDSVGFHGNGNDAYAAVNLGTDEQGTNVVWVTVLNTNGTVRYSKSVSEDVAITAAERADVAIDETGRVLVVYDAQLSFDEGATLVRSVMGRLLDRDGNFLGGTFYVSEKELPAAATLESRRPRAAWRGDLAAITWESLNSGAAERVVALRLFSVGGAPGGDLVASIERAGAGTIRLTWTGGNGPFTVQKKTSLTDPNWTDVLTTANREAEVPSEGATGFLRVAGAP
jgi:hypothetical protein